MSLTSEKYKEEFACTGGVAYNVTDFRIWASEDEEVVHVTTAGVETTLTPTTSYAISNIASTGFTVTTVQSYSSGTLVVRRNQPKTQEADWERNGPLSTPVLEEQLDKIVAMVQSNAELLARTILQTATADSVLAFPVASASALIGWNLAGDGLENKQEVDADLLGECETARDASVAAQVISESAATNAETAQAAAELAIEGLHYSVTTYGATGDGATDDTTSIQAAIDAAISDDRSVYFPAGTYLVTGLTLSASAANLQIEGEGIGIATIKGYAGTETLLTFGDNNVYITFRNISFSTAAIGLSIPDEVTVSTILLDNVIFTSITDKAFYVADNSSGVDGGLVKCTMTNVLFYQVKYGFYSLHNAMVNNLHFYSCSWENPEDGGYQLYIGGVDTTTICTNISVENCLFDGTATSTSIPIFIGGRIADIFIKNVHFADWPLTGGTNDGLALITIDGDTSDIGPEIIVIDGLNASSSRGSIINNLASGYVGTLSIKNSHLYCSRAGDAVILNADKIRYFVSSGNRYSSDTAFSAPLKASYNNEFDISGTSLPKTLNGAIIADIVNPKMTVETINTLANEAIPTVLGKSCFLTGGTTTITDFDDGISGQVIKIISEHAITITDGTNIFLNGSANFVMAETDTLTLICKADLKWYETSRSDNT